MNLSDWLADVELAINVVFNPLSDAANAVVFWEVPLGDYAFPWIVAWLIIAGAAFTCYLRGIQFTGFRHSIERIRGKFSSDDDPGEVSHFQALTSAVSGTVGLGNIAGVAVAVTVGGPGATFWMILAGFLGMCAKFVECTLGVKYRTIHEDGTVTGGPLKYLPVAFQGWGVAAKVLTSVFAVGIFSFGIAGGSMFQTNQTFAQAKEVTGGEAGILGSDGAALTFGLVVAVLVAVVILGGIKSIGRVTSWLVPAMALIYIVACLFVMLANVTNVPAAFGTIIGGAFHPEGVAGGFVGALIAGFQRAAVSNEAGLGSAPIAHSAAKTRHPVSEGYVALIEPFLDTVIICTMTALTIVIAAPPEYRDAQEAAQAGNEELDGVTLTSAAFETFLPHFPVVLSVAVMLFAFSTLITWAYYSTKAWTTLFGHTRFQERLAKTIYCFFIVIGTVLTLDSVLTFTDAAVFVSAFINLLGCYLLLPVVKSELQNYKAKLGRGEIAAIDGSADAPEL